MSDAPHPDPLSPQGSLPDDSEAGRSASAGWTMRQAQAEVDQWIQTIGVRYFSELTNLAQLVEEVGEVARILARSHGDQSAKPGESLAELPDELADVLFVVICLANQSGIDLEAALRQNLAKKTGRDRDRHHRNPKLRAQPASDPAGSGEGNESAS